MKPITKRHLLAPSLTLLFTSPCLLGASIVWDGTTDDAWTGANWTIDGGTPGDNVPANTNPATYVGHDWTISTDVITEPEHLILEGGTLGITNFTLTTGTSGTEGSQGLTLGASGNGITVTASGSTIEGQWSTASEANGNAVTLRAVNGSFDDCDVIAGGPDDNRGNLLIANGSTIGLTNASSLTLNRDMNIWNSSVLTVTDSSLTMLNGWLKLNTTGDQQVNLVNATTNVLAIENYDQGSNVDMNGGTLNANHIRLNSGGGTSPQNLMFTFQGGAITLNNSNPLRDNGNFEGQFNWTGGAGSGTITHTDLSAADSTLGEKVAQGIFSINGTRVDPAANGTDITVLNDELETLSIDGLNFVIDDTVADQQTLSLVITDTDNDNLPDDWENSTAGNLTDLTGLASGPGPGTGTGDFDGDTLSDIDEFNNNTNPILADGDGDGLTDPVELNGSANTAYSSEPTDPNDADSDDDGISDGNETAGENASGVSHGFGATNPNLADTDSDGWDDEPEIINSFDPTSAGSTPSQSAGWSLVEDFDSLGLNIGDPFDGVNGWSTGASISSIIDEPISGSDQVGSIEGAGSIEAVQNSLEDKLLSILEGNTGTLFCQFHVGPGADNGLSFTDSRTPTGFPDYEASLHFDNDGGNAGRLAVRVPGGADAEQTFTENTWYNVWIVADNSADTYEVYVQEAGSGTQVQLSWDDGGSPNTLMAFRNGPTTDPLRTFLSVISNNSAGGEFSYYDNLYVDPLAKNLTLPAADKPATVTTPPSITNVAFNGSGDLLITFSPGGAGFILTSSDDLVSPFTEETNATYDDVDTFTVPASALNAGSDYFRVEGP